MAEKNTGKPSWSVAYTFIVLFAAAQIAELWWGWGGAFWEPKILGLLSGAIVLTTLFDCFHLDVKAMWGQIKKIGPYLKVIWEKIRGKHTTTETK